MARIKLVYALLLLVITIFAVFYAWTVIGGDLASDPSLALVAQGIGVFVALIASVIALAVADPKDKTIRMHVDVSMTDPHHHGAERTSYRVNFTIRNNSGFTLEKPVLSFKVPNELRHPPTEGSSEQPIFNSNLFNSRRDLTLLEFADSTVLSNSNLPYWNDKDSLMIWIRMAVREQEASFDVPVSLNAQGVRGITEVVSVHSATLLAKKGS